MHIIHKVVRRIQVSIFKNKTNQTDIDEEARIIPIQKEGELNYGMDIQTEQVPPEKAISTAIE